MVILPLYSILVFANIQDGFTRKQQGIYYIFSSVSAVIGAMFLTLLVKNGWLYLPFTATYFLPLGILIDSLIITFAQSKRFNDLAKERQLFFLELMDTKNQVLQTQESERQRIAADLHDDLGGTLATIRRRIADIRQNLKDPKAAQDFELLEPLIQKSADDLRRISHNLMPPEFAHLGLVNALQQFVQAIPQSPTHFEFLISGKEQKLSVNIELNIYRIVSELVQNVLKHAHATRAAVQLIYFDDSLTITVEDNGVGDRLINKSSEISEISSGIGLKNSKLRAEYIGAKLCMETSGGGTLVILEIPYLPTDNDASPPKNSFD
jgi:signal transduction histidine kinase